MYRSTQMPAGQERRGVILLVVITLLTLFAVVGLTFVYYAESEATASRIFREAQDGTPDGGRFVGLPPESVFSWTLGQIIYPVPDPDTNQAVYSAVRGHELSRKMYGWNDQVTGVNQTPYNGLGRMHASVSHPNGELNGMDEFFLPNYQFFRDSGDNFLRDPERPGSRGGLGAARRPWVGGDHAPYTYPDLNNFYLAAVKADNTVMVPSYHRPWLFGPLLYDPANPNPNWTNTIGKYLTLRPRPIDNGPGFPYPGDAGGDVKNLVGGPGGNDSIWIDLGYPVQSFTDFAGRAHYYKPLFAILIRDLDSLVNVNAHGNILLPGNSHASHQGWGKWEINQNHVLDVNANEWKNIFLGGGGIPGRYGNNGVPSHGPGGTVPPAPQVSVFTPSYSQYNYNAMTDSNPLSFGQPFDLPGAGGYTATTSFPRYNVGGGSPVDRGYGNSSAFEVTNHPSLFDYFLPRPVFPLGAHSGFDRTFDLSEIRKLFCYAPGSFSELNTSELARLCPNNLNANTVAAMRRRHMITTHSVDLDSPGVSAMVWDPTAAGQRFELASGALFPVGGPIPRPTSFGTVPPGSEFGPDGRALSAKLPRLDLNRPLRDYPDPVGGVIDIATAGAQFAQAEQDRKTLARDVFIRLCAATGTPCTFDYNTGNPVAAAYTTPEMANAARWLAQLAVNIVDFIDNDDFMTPFHWNQTYTPPGGDRDNLERNAFVFGTELNRVVLNEVYVEYTNHPNDPFTGGVATMDYLVKIWAELLNPLHDSQVRYDGGDARFTAGMGMGAFNPYRLVVTLPFPGLRDPANVRGEPDPAPGKVKGTLNDWTGHPVLSPSGGAGSNPMPPGPTFYSLIGPRNPVNNQPEPFPGAGPPALPTAHLNAAELVYTSPLLDAMGNPAPVEPPTLLLRRLACPYFPEQPDPTQPLYNPYITVDYVDMSDPDPTKLRQQVNQAITNDTTGAVMSPAPQDRKSWGRRQPYAAHNTMRVSQTLTTPHAAQPQHTFPDAMNVTQAGNSPVSTPFDWLVIRDRPLINAAELLDVPAYKPFEVLQQFIIDQNMNGTLDPSEDLNDNGILDMGEDANGNGVLDIADKFRHRAWWRHPASRIYRALEWLTVHDRAAGLTIGGRIPGRVNINTIYDPEILRALVDANISNHFQDLTGGPNLAVYNPTNPDDPTTLWGRLVAQRTPRLNQANNWITPNDRPFQGLAVPFAPPVTSFNQPPPTPNTPAFTFTPTVTTPSDTLLNYRFKLDGMPHPNLENELLTKILGNTTTRSNTFAVWITVGYFEVTDLNSRPVKLGPEFRPHGGSVVRQRAFAIVDRTGLSLFNPVNPALLDEMTRCSQVTGTGLQTVAFQPPAGGVIEPGTLLRLKDSYFGQEEVVTVVSVDTTAVPPTFTANFARTHTVPPVPPPMAFPISVAILGNPGPQPTFSYTNRAKYGHVVPHFHLLN